MRRRRSGPLTHLTRSTHGEGRRFSAATEVSAIDISFGGTWSLFRCCLCVCMQVDLCVCVCVCMPEYRRIMILIVKDDRDHCMFVCGCAVLSTQCSRAYSCNCCSSGCSACRTRAPRGIAIACLACSRSSFLCAHSSSARRTRVRLVAGFSVVDRRFRE